MTHQVIIGNRGLYRIVIPTRDSERWIATLGKAYQRIGVAPLYLYDTRSADATLSELSRIGAEVLPITCSHERVEAMLPTAASEAKADWVVRFDDDEFPSIQLINWLDSNLSGISCSSLAISRREVNFVDGHLQYSRLESLYRMDRDYGFLNPQWRVFRPKEVQFDDSIHAPGFGLKDWTLVPPSYYFVHFDWIVRTFTQRLEKLRNYERQRKGAGWGLAHYYLPELYAPRDLRWTTFENDQFLDLARRMAEVGAMGRR